MICGVDEAGRGPVIGPLVVAAVSVEDDSSLRRLKVRDSKQLTPVRREELAIDIRRLARVEVEVIEASDLDDMMTRDNLNEIEVKAFAALISRTRADIVYADACDVDPGRFSRNILVLSYVMQIFSRYSSKSSPNTAFSSGNCSRPTVLGGL